MVLNSDRNATVRADAPSEVLALDAEGFRDLVESSQQTKERIEAGMETRLANAAEKRYPRPSTTGFPTMRYSSIRPCAAKRCSKGALPMLTVSVPGRRFIRAASSSTGARTSRMFVQVPHSTVSSVVEKTTLGRVFIISVTM